MNKLQDVTASSAQVDAVEWYKSTTFNIIGCLAFGDSYSLNTESITVGFPRSSKTFARSISLACLPIIQEPSCFLTSSDLRQAREIHNDKNQSSAVKVFSKSMMEERRGLLSWALKYKHNDDKGKELG
ncbi:hypothetical protein MMC22_000396 [Lobaria immixta]|nr:hypothetical protein [Lobaria immixta]